MPLHQPSIALASNMGLTETHPQVVGSCHDVVAPLAWVWLRNTAAPPIPSLCWTPGLDT